MTEMVTLRTACCITLMTIPLGPNDGKGGAPLILGALVGFLVGDISYNTLAGLAIEAPKNPSMVRELTSVP